MKNFFIAIIPARAGSKELKNKNMLSVNGKPMIHWTIVEALKSKYLKKIIITTNCKKVINYSNKFIKNNKIKILKRPDYLAQDNTKMLPVIKHATKDLIEIRQKNFLGSVLLQPTSPLRKKKDIDKSCSLFIKNKPDSLVSINKLKHIYNPESLYFKNKYKIKKSFKLKNKYLKQKKPVYYSPNGAAIYITSSKNINKFIIGGNNIIGYEMSYFNSIDVDTADDLKLANLLLKNNG